MAELEHNTTEKNAPQNALQCSKLHISYGKKPLDLQPLDCGEKMKQMQAVTQSAVKIWITPSFMEKKSCRKEQNREH